MDFGETNAELRALVGKSAVMSVVLPGQDEAALAWVRVAFEEPATINEGFFDEADWIGQNELLRIRFRHGTAVYIGGIRDHFAKPSY